MSELLLEIGCEELPGGACREAIEQAPRLMAEALEEALAGAIDVLSITDKRGTVEYRRKVVGVLCRRAGAIARDRALGN